MALDGFRIDTSQLDAWADQVEKLPAEIQAKMIAKATRAGAEVIAAEVIALAPVRVTTRSPHSRGLRPGWVKADIHITPTPSKLGWYIGPSAMTAYVVRWLEYGHRLVRRESGGASGKRRKGLKVQIGKVDAHPFLRKAFDVSKEAAMEAARKSLAEQIAAWWRSISKKAA